VVVLDRHYQSKKDKKRDTSTDVEIIMIGRLSLRDPYWPLRAAHELGVEVDYWPNQYIRGTYPA
jgi:2,4-dienoyl-CoA reductase-like NADH-dependent reductase (Old Yellow Enzyme family)